MRDYLAFLRPKPEDALQYGVRGMKWGVRRSDAQLTKDSSSSDTPSASVKALTGEETSAGRYARLAGEAKGGGAKSWTEQDLKFFNARTEALSKVNKMYETQPNWLAKTSKQVLLNATQRSMQDIANGVAGKVVTGPILGALGKKADSAPKETAGVKAAVKAVQKQVSTATSTTPTTSSPRIPGMTPAQSLDYIRAYQANRLTASQQSVRSRPTTSVSGNFDLFNQLREEGLID